jgi:GNAT superfamily N-acetyltransferase
MNIRRVNPEKYQGVLDAMQLACLPSDELCAYKPDDLWFIAFDAGTPAAFGCVRPLPLDPGVWYLARAGVLDEYQGRGLQKRLIAARLRAAKRAGAGWVYTDCTAVNYGSANSLIACGFKLFKPGRAWALPNSLYWRKALC